MNKEDLIRKIAQCEESVSQRQARVVLDRAMRIVSEALESGEPVIWTGFGSFVRKDVPPKNLYSLKDKCCKMTSGKKVIAFRQSKSWVIK